MDRFAFWYRWLLLVSVGIIAFGVFMAIFNQSAAFAFLNARIDPVFWGESRLPEAANQFQGWVYGVLGATMAGWGVMLFFIVRNPYRQREKWAWEAIMLSLGIWYLLDLGISLNFGVITNAVFNTLLVVLALPPVWFTRKHFRLDQNPE